MKSKRSFYGKTQTVWVTYPAFLQSSRCDTTVAIGIYPEHCANERPVEAAKIFLTPHEAKGFAAWLSEQADHILAKQARNAARRAARLAAKESKP